MVHEQDIGVRGISRGRGRSASSISRALRRNAGTTGGTLEYRATLSQKADGKAARPKACKLASNDWLSDHVQARLGRQIS